MVVRHDLLPLSTLSRVDLCYPDSIVRDQFGSSKQEVFGLQEIDSGRCALTISLHTGVAIAVDWLIDTIASNSFLLSLRALLECSQQRAVGDVCLAYGVCVRFCGSAAKL